MQALDVSENSTQPFGSPLDEARRLLDGYAAGGVAPETLADGLVKLCGIDPDTSWPVLAWLDQYHRRGIVDSDLFRDLKERIARLAVPAQTMRVVEAPQPVRVPTETATPGSDVVSVSESLSISESISVSESVVVSENIPEPEPSPPTLRRRPARTQTPPSADPQAESGSERGFERVLRMDEAPAPLVAPRYTPGTLLRGRYELVGELGRGGMGSVYRARDRERRGLPGLGEHVALKVLREDWVSRPDALAALRQECFRAQSLSHPNIVNVYDWDRDGDTCFVTMELVDGEPLSRVLDRVQPHRLARPHALGILQSVGEALVYAHANGVVHADLKPANIIVGHNGRVRVLDFGMARPVLREPYVAGEAGSTLRAATPAYASPEVLRGANPVPRDDVFSFACLAYELLSGAAPFERQTVKEARRGRPMPVRPKGCTSRDWRSIRRGLAPQREDRPPSVAALMQELLREEIDPLPPLRVIVDTARAERRPFWPWLLGFAVLAGAAVLSTFVLDELSSTRLPSSISTAKPPGTKSPEAPPMGQREVRPAVAPPVADEVESSSDENPAAASAAVEEPVQPDVGAADRPDPASVSARDAPAPAESQPATTPVESVPTGPRTIGLQPASLAVGEREGAARLAIVRTGPLDRALEVRWWTEPGEAMADDDYADFGARIERFAPGQSRITLLIPIVADAVRESTETFSVVIAASENQTQLAARRATIIVVDDD